MPIFEYRCPHCGQLIEKIQRRPLVSVECKSCGKQADRIVSLASVAASGVGSCSAPAGGGFT